MKNLLFLILISATAYSQSMQGLVLSEKDKSPLAFAKVGIAGRGVGTIADENGNFSLEINSKYLKDSLRFSCPGYQTFSINISDYKHLGVKTILLKEKTVTTPQHKELTEKAVSKTYGSIGGSLKIIEINGGLPGSEAGVIFNFTTASQLEKLTLQVDSCSLDTIFFRINIYRPLGDKRFQNIQARPVYYKAAGDNLEDKSFSIDLSAENIWVKGNTLITIEQVKSFNKGIISFNGKPGGNTWGRRASHANWRMANGTMSMTVQAKSEK